MLPSETMIWQPELSKFCELVETTIDLDTLFDKDYKIKPQPAIGKVGKTEQVQEAKVEVILPETIEKQVIQAMRSAYDLAKKNQA